MILVGAFQMNYSILFYSILFYSILFYSILFYSILFYSIPILFYSISILFYSVLFLVLFLLGSQWASTSWCKTGLRLFQCGSW